MISKKLIIATACVAAAVLSIMSFIPKEHKYTAANKGFAVVELFTSEGCSSCPPADELIAEIQQESANQPVYILAYHVDYWNRLGWKDVFSSHAYSNRQYQYSNWLKLNGVYTPQAVVNGRKEFIGSEEGNLRNAIKSGLQSTPPATLQLSEVKQNEHEVTLKYQAGNAGSNTSLVLAIVQKSATSSIKAGENNGRTLTHVQIVRNLETLPLNGKSSGNAKVSVPAGLSNMGIEIIGLLQNSATGEIMAASGSNLRLNNDVAQIRTGKF